MRKILASVFFMLVVYPLSAQFTYEVSQEVSVMNGSEPLLRAWSGGLNSPQYSTIDLNGDGEQDLVAFDRSSATIYTFLSESEQYVYAPEYQADFPTGIRNWMLLRDFNCDGKKDIFASDPRGVVVYVNTTEEDGESLQWRIFNFREDQGFRHLLTQGFTSAINLQINGSDVPAIADVDNDGDIDILTYRFSGSSTVEFHKNLSMERDGNCDSLQFERVTQTWGEFEECQCGSFAFNGSDCSAGGRTEHQGGKSLLTLDMDGDNVQDLIVSEEECTELFRLENQGTADDALMVKTGGLFPNNDNPASLFVFPAAYSEDVDFDGVKDLLVAPNVAGNVSSSVNFESSSWFYKNNGTDQIPDYELTQRNFLQDGMIDVGENAAPAFADLDDDGDLDMLLGSYLNFEELGFRSSLVLYENVGTTSNPAFEIKTTDYLSVSGLALINIRPSFYDVNNDGNLDLLFSGTSVNNGSTDIYYALNQSSGGADFGSTLDILFNISSVFPNNENYTIHDIDADGLPDVLIGRSSGRLEYYRNIGSESVPEFALEDQSFYDIDFSAFSQSPAASISDFDGDGNLDMLTGDAGGNLTIYDDFLSSLDEPNKGVSKLFRDRVTEDSLAVRFGARLIPTAANIFNADKPAIVVGTGAGGVVLLKHDDAIVNPVNPNEGAISIYPNPVQHGDFLTIGVAKSMTLSIISITGQVVFGNISLKSNQTVDVEIGALREGIYVVVGRRNDDIEARRFVVVK